LFLLFHIILPTKFNVFKPSKMAMQLRSTLQLSHVKAGLLNRSLPQVAMLRNTSAYRMRTEAASTENAATSTPGSSSSSVIAPAPVMPSVSMSKDKEEQTPQQWYRFGVSAATVGAVFVATPYMSSQVVTMIHLSAFGLLMGTNMWNTLIGATMFKIVPRQTFGKIQATLFPIYFPFTSTCAGIMLATLANASNPALSSSAALTPIVVALALNVVNQLYLEPASTKLMFDRHAIENKVDKTEEDKVAISTSPDVNQWMSSTPARL
jgi:hypothetical protein